ncbi:hypothetical protein RRG08_058351 [Elysia crispata]|uniref:Uncharacterized protein n=1 Tax=Elysia crispata TaxID=231223 RepID=A0AAE1CU82_9GAST|nr:hypothetical protein RRG08_058351 [Elysia crispata]
MSLGRPEIKSKWHNKLRTISASINNMTRRLRSSSMPSKTVLLAISPVIVTAVDVSVTLCAPLAFIRSLFRRSAHISITPVTGYSATLTCIAAVQSLLC